MRPSRFIPILLAALVVFTAIGCTVVVYRDPPTNNGTNGPPPKVVDMLVLVDLQRGTANVAQDYGTIIGTVMAGLGEQNVSVRQAAMAPMYRRSSGVVPLLYGENDEDSEFANVAEAMLFYTRDDGANYLQDEASADGENLAALGMELDQRAVYHPTTADPDARAYYLEPADGFVVLYLTAAPRRCGHADSDCKLDGARPAHYFTSEDDRGVEWMRLPGGSSVPNARVFHGVIATAEGVDYDTFRKDCTGQPNFPATKLDVMEPSDEVYFGPYVESIDNAGGNAHFIDMCEAMSTRGQPAVLQMTAEIRAMFR